jgi:hypothetical protein
MRKCHSPFFLVLSKTPSSGNHSATQSDKISESMNCCRITATAVPGLNPQLSEIYSSLLRADSLLSADSTRRSCASDVDAKAGMLHVKLNRGVSKGVAGVALKWRRACRTV